MRIPLRQVATLSGDKSLNILNTFMKETNKALNWIEFGDGTNRENMAIDFVTITNAAGYVADAEIVVPHTLNGVPKGYIVINQSVAGSLYDSGTAWTTTNIYLKFDVAGAATIKIMVF